MNSDIVGDIFHKLYIASRIAYFRNIFLIDWSERLKKYSNRQTKENFEVNDRIKCFNIFKDKEWVGCRYSLELTDIPKESHYEVGMSLGKSAMLDELIAAGLIKGCQVEYTEPVMDFVISFK